MTLIAGLITIEMVALLYHAGEIVMIMTLLYVLDSLNCALIARTTTVMDW